MKLEGPLQLCPTAYFEEKMKEQDSGAFFGWPPFQTKPGCRHLYPPFNVFGANTRIGIHCSPYIREAPRRWYRDISRPGIYRRIKGFQSQICGYKLWVLLSIYKVQVQCLNAHFVLQITCVITYTTELPYNGYII